MFLFNDVRTVLYMNQVILFLKINYTAKVNNKFYLSLTKSENLFI